MLTREDIINNVEYPICYIAGACRDFYKLYEGRVISIESQEDLDDMVAYYTGLSDIGRPLVFEIASTGKDFGGNTKLLKFVEDSKLPIVMLMRVDKLDRVLGSRFRKVVKYGNPVKSEFLSVDKASEVLSDKIKPDMSYYNKVKLTAQYCPELWVLEQTIRNKKVRDKMIRMK